MVQKRKVAEIAVEIRQVSTKQELKKFIDFPFLLYKDNAYWCPPLKFDEYNTLNRKKNPAFEYCEAGYWMAFHGNRPVGRIAGIINHHANQRWNEKLVRFGWIDFIDDPAVTSALIREVENWGKMQGMTGIQGPLGFTDMDAEGMLIEGFGQISAMAAIYNYPYYPEYFEKAGFRKAVDWVQYSIPVPDMIPPKVERMAKIVAQKHNLRILISEKRKDLLPYARKMFEMQNIAFNELYGFAALTERQMDLYTNQYFGFIRKEFVSFVIDEKDEVIAFGISLPDISGALRKCNGTLFPFGFFHLMRGMKKNDAIHMYLLGVRPDYHGKGVLAMIFEDLHKAYLENGIKITTTHPQLEENIRALSIWKNYEGRVNIRRRCWIKSFTDDSPDNGIA